MRDIQGGDRNNVFKISCSGVTIDGGGHTIKGISNGFNSGIYVDGGSVVQNINIKNCVFEGVDFGIWFYRVEGGTIQNCTFKDCKNMGIRLDQSRTNTITDNTLIGNVLGIGIFQSAGNKITNNYFKNQFNAVANDDQRNFWSTESQAGTNIAGGTTRGGNLWLDMNGSGFSFTNPDLNHDGFTDAPYSINGINIDYYPLSISQTGTEPSKELIPTPVRDVPSDVSDNSSLTKQDTIQVTNNTTEVSETLPEENSPVGKDSPSTNGSADLMISNLNTTESSCIASEIPVSITIENIGDIEAKDFSLHYYLSENQGITPSNTEVGYRKISSLKPHEKQEYTDTIKIPSGTGVRSYSFGAIVDPSNDIYETSKSNNVALLNHQIQIKDCTN